MIIHLPPRFTLPTRIHHKYPFVQAQLNGRPRLFMFDSGAQEITLNSRHVDQGQAEVGSGGHGFTGKVTGFYTSFEELSFGEWRFRDGEAMAMDLQHLEEELDLEFHGLIGFRQLVHYDWMIDYAAGEISFWDRINKADFNIAEKVVVQYIHHLPLIDLTIAGRPYRFLVDTGAPEIVMDRKLQGEVASAISDTVTEDMASSSPEKVAVESGTLNGFRVGKLEFGESEIKFAEFDHIRTRFAGCDGILGYDLLRQYRTIVSWSVWNMLFLAD